MAASSSEILSALSIEEISRLGFLRQQCDKEALLKNLHVEERTAITEKDRLKEWSKLFGTRFFLSLSCRKKQWHYPGALG